MFANLVPNLASQNYQVVEILLLPVSVMKISNKVNCFYQWT